MGKTLTALTKLSHRAGVVIRWVASLAKAVIRWLQSLDEQLARGALILGELPARPSPETASRAVIPTGSTAFDRELGGGWPRGALVEVLGPLGAGKSAFAWAAVLACQKAGGVACYVDVDRGLAGVVRSLPPDTPDTPDAPEQRIWIVEPVSGEATWGMVAGLLSRDCVDLVVIDSVNAMVSQAELDADWCDFADDWEQARWLNAGLYQLVGQLRKASATVLCLRQTTPAGQGSGQAIQPTRSTPHQVTDQQRIALPFLADIRVLLSGMPSGGQANSLQASSCGISLLKVPQTLPETSEQA